MCVALCQAYPRGEDSYFPELGSKLVLQEAEAFSSLTSSVFPFYSILGLEKTEIIYCCDSWKDPLVSPRASLVTGQQIDSLLVTSGPWHLGKEGVVTADHHSP